MYPEKLLLAMISGPKYVISPQRHGSFSQVTQPPIVSALFQLGIPSAERIQHPNHRKPREVHDLHVVAVAGWKQLSRATHGGRRQQQEVRCSITKKVEHNSQNVNHSQMDHKKEKWHAAKDNHRIG